MRHTLIAVVMVLALVLLGGCGAATSSSGSAAASLSKGATKLCQPLTTINQSLTQLSNVGDNTTVGQVKAAQQKVTSALNSLTKLPLPSGKASTALSNLQTANNQLTATLSNQPDSATLSQAGVNTQNFKAKVTQAQGAATKLGSTLHC